MCNLLACSGGRTGESWEEGGEGSEDCTISILSSRPPHARGCPSCPLGAQSISPRVGQTDGKRRVKRGMWSALTCRRGSGIRNPERVTIEREAGRGQGTADGRNHAIAQSRLSTTSVGEGKGGKRDVQMDQSRKRTSCVEGECARSLARGGTSRFPFSPPISRDTKERA